MGLSVGNQIIKLILFIFNFLWLLFGLVLIIVGALIYTECKLFVDSLKDIDLPAFAIFLLVIGVITVIISFCGCCGAIQESQCLTVTYSVMLFLIIIVEITVAIVIFVKMREDAVEEFINKNIQAVFDDTKYKEEVNKLQELFQCCGTTGHQSWNGTVPDSCCPENKPCKTDKYFEEGCAQMLIDFIVKYKNVLGLSTLGFAIVEFIAFVFSCILAKNMD